MSTAKLKHQAALADPSSSLDHDELGTRQGGYIVEPGQLTGAAMERFGGHG
jgi:hypothetical protein